MRITKHEAASRLLREIAEKPAQHCAIHYSSEGFGGRVAAIAIRNLGSEQEKSFSVSLAAQKKKIPPERVAEHFDGLEGCMLEEYFEYLQSHDECKYIHWNMRNVYFGFYALEHRFEALSGKKAYELPNERKIDLASLLCRKYGNRYIGHPRLKKLLDKNGVEPKGFLDGLAETEAIARGDYAAASMSALAKVDAFAEIAEMAAEGSLKTEARWRDMYGLTASGALAAMRATWYGTALLAILSALAGAAISKAAFG
jgi:hypothetical protein